MSNEPTATINQTPSPSTTTTFDTTKLNTGSSATWRETMATEKSTSRSQSSALGSEASLHFPTTEAAVASAVEYLQEKGYCPQQQCNLPTLLPPNPDEALYRAVSAYSKYVNYPEEKFIHELHLPSFDEYVRLEGPEVKAASLKRKGLEFNRELSAEEAYYGLIVHELSHTLGRKELGAESPRWESEAFRAELEFYKSRGVLKNFSDETLLNIVRDYPPERAGRELGFMMAETLDKEPTSNLKGFGKYVPYSTDWKNYFTSEQRRVQNDLDTLPSSEEAKKDRQEQLQLIGEWLDPFGADAVQGHIKKGIESYLVDKKQAQPRTPELYKQVDTVYEKIRSRGILSELEQTVEENA